MAKGALMVNMIAAKVVSFNCIKSILKTEWKNDKREIYSNGSNYIMQFYYFNLIQI